MLCVYPDVVQTQHARRKKTGNFFFKLSGRKSIRDFGGFWGGGVFFLEQLLSEGLNQSSLYILEDNFRNFRNSRPGRLFFYTPKEGGGDQIFRKIRVFRKIVMQNVAVGSKFQLRAQI